jgi:hypothetical protein
VTYEDKLAELLATQASAVRAPTSAEERAAAELAAAAHAADQQAKVQQTLEMARRAGLRLRTDADGGSPEPPQPAASIDPKTEQLIRSAGFGLKTDPTPPDPAAA